MQESSGEEPKVFVFTGHGDDNGETSQLPPGITLVTFTTCGSTTTAGDSFQLLMAMKEKGKDFFENPADPIKREAIESFLARRIRVYTKGGEYPNLIYHSTAAHSAPLDDKATWLENYDIIYNSGVYEAPIKTFEENPEWKLPGRREAELIEKKVVTEADRFAMYGYLRERPSHQEKASSDAIKSDYVDGVIKSYKGAVFPDPATITKIANGQSDVFSIEEVFNKLGPGVYYWPICRGDLEMKNPEQKERMLTRRRRSDIKQIEGHLKRVLKLQGGGRRKTHRKRHRRFSKKSLRH